MAISDIFINRRDILMYIYLSIYKSMDMHILPARQQRPGATQCMAPY